MPRGLAEHLQHGQIGKGAFPEAGDVEESDLVGALLVVSSRERDGLAEVAHVALAGRSLAHVVLVALGDDQIARIIRAHVEARDDALAKPGRERARHRRGLRRWRLVDRIADERLEQAQADGTRLLRMELHGRDAPPGDAAHVRLAVPRQAERPRRELGGGCHSERVHKVKSVAQLDAVEQRRLLLWGDAIPPNLRDGEAFVDVESADPPRQQPEPLAARAFVRALEECLHAQADAEKRPIGAHICAQRLDEALHLQHLHTIAKRAHAREEKHTRR
mmetsp:Transcript_41032/g.95811  ORF Transcript_41032/g.95811 Transcript_41032/m.95811 type:complete len:276 (-) Transcript_41032:161-988(-)